MLTGVLPHRRRCTLGGLETLIEEETGINTVVAEEPAMAVAIGTGQYMELMSKINGK